MKRLMIICILLMHMLAAWSIPCFAEGESVSVDIWIRVNNGGTTEIIADEGTPLPAEPTLKLKPGKEAAYHIEYFTPGTFSYTVRLIPDGRDMNFDQRIYDIEVYVIEENGVLYASIVIYDYETGEKYDVFSVEDQTHCLITFKNTQKDESEDPDPEVKPDPSNSTPPSDPGGNARQGTKAPNTGDDTPLIRHLLTAVFASAGLFLLAVLYYISVKQEIRHKSHPE